MSGIAGIYSFDRKPIDRWHVSLLGNALDERGPDGGGEIVSGSIAMVYRAFHTNAESRREQQPLISSCGQMLCWDGRLDNRDELIALFGDELAEDRTDARLVLAAYHKWRENFLSRIIGDFALSLWDSSSNTLILARDPFGVRPLYYFRNRDELVWSSTLGSLLALPMIDLEVNDEYVAGCLALYPELSSTPYRNIHAVEPGQIVTIENGRFQSRQFWTPADNDEIRYSNDQEYEEHFRELFREAVSCRLRSDRPVWSELSGGLDSSSIVFMADHIQKLVHSIPVTTLSFLDSRSATFFDQRFIEVVERERRHTGVHLDGGGHWISLASPEDGFIATPTTSVCVADLHRRMWQQMKDDGARVLLSGLGGDQVTWSTQEPGAELGDLLFAGRPLRLHQRLQVWSEATKQPYAQLLWQEVILTWSPVSFRARFQDRIEISSWLNRDFVKRMKIDQRLLLPSDPFGFELPSRRIQSSRIRYIVMNIARGEHWEHAAYEKTYPFLHRPLVEFMMTVPIAQKLRPTETRSLMRRALRDLLPKKILERRSKGTTGEAVCRGLANEWSRIRPLLSDARLSSRGYVDMAKFMRALDRARYGIEFNISGLVQALALEIWLRSLERGVKARSTVAAFDVAAPHTRTNLTMRAAGAV